MKKIDSASLYRVISNLSAVNELFRSGSEIKEHLDSTLAASDKKLIREMATKIKTNSADIGATVNSIAADDLIKELRKKGTKYKDLSEGTKILESIFRKEM